MSDPIITELWKIKEGLAKECGYDLGNLFERLKTAQKSEKQPVVNRTRLRNPVASKVAEAAPPYPAK